MSEDPQQILRAMFDAAVASAQPDICVPPYLPAKPPKGRFIVIGAGKASAAMARAVEKTRADPLEGLVVTRYGYAVPCERIEIIEAAHPVPDTAGANAARRMLEYVRHLTSDDLVLCLISGGASSLLPLPLDGLTLEGKQIINRDLLRCGATISEINCVRRHLSAVKGGRLGAVCHPAKLITLLISDVPGDDPKDIGSGPTVGDPTTCADALAILARSQFEVSAAVTEILETGSGETVKPSDPRLSGTETQLIATPQIALEAAAKVARRAGYAAHILSDAMEGEAREAGVVLSGLARQVALRNQPFMKPCILLSGGELTVTVRGLGRGGPNAEFLLSLALALKGQSGIYALAADTDGVDGLGEIAGAIFTPDTLARAHALGLNAADALADNDGHGFFESLGDGVITGPTHTNVNDFRAILIE